MNFWKSLLAAFLALVIFSVLSFILFIAVLAVGLSGNDAVVIHPNTVLHLKLDAEITEREYSNPLAGLPIVGQTDVPRIGLIELKETIRHAQEDDNIQGIYLDISHPRAGFSSLEEIRQSLIEFRESGKWVVAYTETMTEGAYYLASAADKIYLNPEGEVEFNGLSVEIMFFKKLFDKLEIRPEIFRVGSFKSAVEPFLLEKMSPENKLQLTELMNSVYGHMLNRIADARHLPVERLKEISDKMLVRNAALARELGLVDSLLYRDQFRDHLKTRLKLSGADTVTFVKYGQYRRSVSDYKSASNEIAVIVADGSIMPGKAEAEQRIIGADTFVEAIRRAREDDNIKAIVLRINSPGGEFRASDMMWREVTLARKQKPVIASMSDYAASGGYYLAMACDTIVAQPHTITGSIGIFGMMFDLSEFLSNKVGITFDEVRTGEFGDMYTLSRPLTDAERNYWQKSLDDHYASFTRKAAEGRGLPVEEIEKVASGRVWSGAQALDHKLVDVLGGFDDAVNIAAAKAGVAADYKLRFYPEQELSIFEQLMSQWEEDARTEALQAELGDLYGWYQQVHNLKSYQGVQARMPFELRLH
ncbi:signal peptide peptidase SppA [Fulvivirgaceae bacterium PWU5]|uniref:Signal peptide peptidase SppA n=1 Tax=Dawidia cretensis TaxID=2782350 RepID=A0AAP2GW39_9BACT|nr:signal peptide peptidase SppA [Dawidia cretensis]MBT1711600.1 signal peptide peptidase SppA [Dawidia cretensis]